MMFFPEVAVQFFFFKHWALGPRNCHEWISHPLVWFVCNLKIYISKNLSLSTPCVLYTYYKYVLSSFSPLTSSISGLRTRRGSPCASPRHRAAALWPRSAALPGPAQHLPKPKCRGGSRGEGGGAGALGGRGRGIWPTFYIREFLNNINDDGITACLTFGFSTSRSDLALCYSPKCFPCV